MSEGRLVLCKTPIQIVLAQALVRDLGVTGDLVETVGPPEALAYLDHECWEHTVYVVELALGRPLGSASCAEVLRYRLSVVARCLIGYWLPRRAYDTVYLFNDADVTCQALLSKVAFRSLVFLDEGLAWIGGKLIGSPPPPTGLKRRVKLLLGLHDEGYRQLERMDARYVFEPGEAGDGTRDFAAVLKRQHEYICSLAERVAKNLESYIEADYLILTQPLTESGFCTRGGEVRAVEEFLNTLPADARIVLKRHPREPVDKYQSALRVNPAARELEVAGLPYELLHARLRPRHLVSFFSNVLVMAQYFYRSRPISLIKWLDLDPKPFVELLDRMAPYEIEYPPRPRVGTAGR